jgi:phosphoribosyl 1,2-cyclic phosphodiesterase
VKVKLWGTRGSLASPGPENLRYGGNTACVEVRGSDGTVLALDAGTGIRRMGAALEPGVKRLDILLTHLHLDHIQGLGFFAPLYRTDLEVHIWGPPSTTLDLGSRLARDFSTTLFPVRLGDLPSRPRLHDGARRIRLPSRPDGRLPHLRRRREDLLPAGPRTGVGRTTLS